MEGRYDAIVEKAAQAQEALERLRADSQPQTAEPGWVEALEQASATHSSELRFVKTLLWITLAAVGLSYGLVVYAVILRSGG